MLTTNKVIITGLRYFTAEMHEDDDEELVDEEVGGQVIDEPNSKCKCTVSRRQSITKTKLKHALGEAHNKINNMVGTDDYIFGDEGANHLTTITQQEDKGDLHYTYNSSAPWGARNMHNHNHR